MNREREQGSLYIIRIYLPIVFLAAFILMPLASFAQELPCDDADPYGNCPVDSWVWVLAVIGVLFAVLMLKKKQRADLSR